VGKKGVVGQQLKIGKIDTVGTVEVGGVVVVASDGQEMDVFFGKEVVEFFGVFDFRRTALESDPDISHREENAVFEGMFGDFGKHIAPHPMVIPQEVEGEVVGKGWFYVGFHEG
jgi:hypothetical protein